MEFSDPHAAHRRAGIPVIGREWHDVAIDGDDLAGVVFQNCVFDRVRLTSTSLWQSVFVQCTFTDCEFVDCRLFRAQYVDCSGNRLRIAAGEFRETGFAQCRFDELRIESSGERVAFAGTEVGRVAFDRAGCRQQALAVSNCTLGAVAAENASFDGLAGVGIDLRVWALENALFERCMLVEACAEELDLSAVRFESCNLYKGNFAGVRIRHAPGTIFAECDCRDADFADAELTGALFARTSAPRARFVGANLTHALFPEATLVEADFGGVRAEQSVWNGADLTDANLERIDAYQATFRNGVLDGARVGGARLVQADLHGVEASLEDADTREARGTLEWRAEREAEARLPPRS